MAIKREVDRRVFLMLIPEHPTYDLAKQFQEEVNEKYYLYRILPKLHITLESIYFQDEGDIQRIIPAINNLCHEVKSFPILVHGFACFEPPYKSVQLHIIKTPPLMELHNRVHTHLQAMGLKVKEYPEGIQFHMTIASPNFADREWTEAEYNQACTELKNVSVSSGFVLKHMELWKPTLDESKKVLAHFGLSEV